MTARPRRSRAPCVRCWRCRVRPGSAAAGPSASSGCWNDGWRASPSATRIGVNAWDGEEWLDGDRFAALLAWAQRLDAIETGAPADTALTTRLLAAAETAGYRLSALRAALAEPDTKRTPRAPRSRKASGTSTKRRA